MPKGAANATNLLARRRAGGRQSGRAESVSVPDPEGEEELAAAKIPNPKFALHCRESRHGMHYAGGRMAPGQIFKFEFSETSEGRDESARQRDSD